MPYLPEIEAVKEALARDLERLERVASKLEEQGNEDAAYEARAWKIAVGRLYLEVLELVDALEEGSFLEASMQACGTRQTAYKLYSEAGRIRYSFVSSPSLPPIASLLNILSLLCKDKG